METLDTVSIGVSSIKTPKDVWAGDKELLSLYPNGIPIEETDYPTDIVLDSIRNAIDNRRKDSRIRLVVDYKSIDEALYWLMPELEDAWQARLKEKPVFEVLEPNEYSSRVNELEEEISQHFAGRSPLWCVPDGYLSAHQGRVLIPSKEIIDSSKKPFVASEWDIAHFQEVLYEELSHAFLRQLRGEWKEDYVKATKNMGPYFPRTKDLSEIIVQYMKENIARKHPEWVLYVVSYKLGLVWKKGMLDYIGIDALAEKLSLHQIAMIDDLKVPYGQNREVLVSFNPRHPYNLKKQAVFEGKGKNI